MIYQWETPYVLDDGRMTATFGLSATPVDAAMRETALAAGLAPAISQAARAAR
jgi:hypothetical protein